MPALVGMPGRINVLTTDIYRALRSTIPPDLGCASAFSVRAGGDRSGAAVFLQPPVEATRRSITPSPARATGRAPFDLGRGRWIAGAIIVFNFLIVLVLPLIVLLWMSLLPFLRGFSIARLRQC